MTSLSFIFQMNNRSSGMKSAPTSWMPKLLLLTYCECVMCILYTQFSVFLQFRNYSKALSNCPHCHLHLHLQDHFCFRIASSICLQYIATLQYVLERNLLLPVFEQSHTLRECCGCFQAAENQTLGPCSP